MTQILDGKAIAHAVRSELAQKVQELQRTQGVRPGLAVLLIGDNPASRVYVQSKVKACEELGFYSIVVTKPSTIQESEVLEYIHSWNANPQIHGILVQLPLPQHIDEHRVLLSIHPSKDVDGFHPENVGRLVAGLPCYVPCTPAGVMEILKRSQIDIRGKHAVVVGRSNIVGKPMANLLYQKAPYANAI
ncbi:MAG: bifunctional 5,10-methylenetetrahydrofolate dehydrogenase/5,10-methenyltetrahydrofolate cyclohydrolase, partial [Bacteroidota bacterium]|nr:bifunctional 5,10-methylenetetrahydrofolate dehydrogenase/5,10-methenyltetrahydrofolate cyclohydrolase [Candidatus Kapabacteria bacterium]MDW8219238.1 bifunctional 5,10-methylenetetrahydrofolate dehydrogenase/5,10-methenyltetrahydrofolate cyclohydrolase [Bacteroidota bacterium]